MAESSFSPLDAIAGYQENQGENETSAFKHLSLDESDVKGEYNDLKSNVTVGDKSFSVMRISNPNDSGISSKEDVADEVKNIARTPKKVENVINEPEASLFPNMDSCDPKSTKLEKNTEINTNDSIRTLKKAHSAFAVRNERRSQEFDTQIASLILEVLKLNDKLQAVEEDMKRVKKDMKEVKEENASLRAQMTRMQQRMDATEENQ
ncbi:uncharacterized protein [Diadema antillarum]|uniref:uncharacterized protein n=1 Tax=Diadema antillarum TaxID=105358 RepID=UPI003A888ACC